MLDLEFEASVGYLRPSLKKINNIARSQWLTPVILATQEAEIWRITVGSQPRQISSQDPISKIPDTKRYFCGVAQGVGPEFKPQYHTHTHI
jgi:hypothetical protein